MELTSKELWTVVHGMILGSIYLLAFTGGLADLWGLKPSLLTSEGLHAHLKRLRIGMWVMAIICWITVIMGTYLIYPWYQQGPQQFLLNNSDVSKWHTFAMEWKIHIAWIAPILMTCVVYIVSYYGVELVHEPVLRKILITLFLASFIAAGVAAIFGAFLSKIAPINLGDFLWNAKNIIAR